MDIINECQASGDKNADTKYFDSYDNLEIHKLMLTDHVRTEAYRTAIVSNRELFKNKTVLDVGAGTGILSIFCAQSGASKVYAVEPNNIAKVAELIIRENKLSDIIQITNGNPVPNNIQMQNKHIDIISTDK